MNIKWNEVTWYSKLLSVIFLLGVVPVLTFYIGTQYEQEVTADISPTTVSGDMAPTPSVQGNAAGSAADQSGWDGKTVSLSLDCGKPAVGFERYCNPRLRYSIDYPSSWKLDLAHEPTDGGGIAFLAPDANVQASIAGWYFSPDTLEKLSGQAGTLTFADGQKGDFSEETTQGMTSFYAQRVTRGNDGIEVDFSATIPAAEYSHMRPILLQMASAIHIFPPNVLSVGPVSAQENFSACLPAGISLSDIVSADTGGNQTTVLQQLESDGAECVDKKLVEPNGGTEIRFYRLTGCWGNPPSNYQDILKKQEDALKSLQAQHNAVIEISCNPSGVSMP